MGSDPATSRYAGASLPSAVTRWRHPLVRARRRSLVGASALRTDAPPSSPLPSPAPVAGHSEYASLSTQECEWPAQAGARATQRAGAVPPALIRPRWRCSQSPRALAATSPSSGAALLVEGGDPRGAAAPSSGLAELPTRPSSVVAGRARRHQRRRVSVASTYGCTSPCCWLAWCAVSANRSEKTTRRLIHARWCGMKEQFRMGDGITTNRCFIRGRVGGTGGRGGPSLHRWRSSQQWRQLAWLSGRTSV